MSSEYGFKEYKALLEKAFKEYQNPMNVPPQLDPYNEGLIYRNAKLEILNWAIEMLPEIEQ